jgi:hypothetical protein
MPSTTNLTRGHTQRCDCIHVAGLFGCLPFTMLTRSIQNYALLEHEDVLHVESGVTGAFLFLFRLLRNNDH